MLSLFKRRRKTEPVTFKSRVDEFWRWFSKNAQRFYDTIEDKRCDDLQPEMTEQMNKLVNGAAWVFGPGANNVGHSFTFTGEGNRHRQLLTAYWLSKAPTLPGWTFYATKQRNRDVTGQRIHFRDLVFDPLEFWLTPYVDEQDEEIDIVIWHPAFPKMEEGARWTAIFLFLDEVLGELGTQSWIGKIEMGDGRLSEAMPLTELASFVDRVVAEHGWKVATPGESWSTYERKTKESGALRGDIVTGSTCLFLLIRDVEEGHIDPDPLEDTGADYVYVVVPKSALAPGKEVESRGIIEDALTDAFDRESSGQVLGGAIGDEHAYIDLLLFDGKNCLDSIQQVLRECHLGKGTSIEYFARSRAAERIVL